jgi:MFS family permease
MLPENILLRYISPNKMIGEAVVAFGAIFCGISGAQNYQTLLALRILGGFAQAFIQGLTVYISLWFKRNEIAPVGGMSAKHNQQYSPPTKSPAVFYSATTISGAFSGLIAYGVEKNLKKANTGRNS